ncbi:MAG: type II toxin-antitoxin system RelE/ParE family toxin, partial [Deltaproteobacteria bacterium]
SRHSDAGKPREYSRESFPRPCRRRFRKRRPGNWKRDLEDLRTPPGNRLEALSGDRQGQHSIRINEQWRVCFVWQDGNANDVEIVDYH